MVADPKTWVAEGESIFTGGVNSGMEPDILQDAQLAWSKNMTTRGGKLVTRGGFVERGQLPGGRVQGIGYFSKNQGQLISQIGGYVYQINISGNVFTSSQVTTPAPRDPDIAEAFMVETSGFFVINDGQTLPLIYDSSTFRHATATEVPTGFQMAFGNGRLWVALSGGRLVAGDIVGTSDGSELKFTENVYLLGGGTFVMPSTITGLAFIPAIDRASGFGVLLVYGKRFTIGMRADIADRSLWSEVNGFQATLFPEIGCTGNATITSVNQDLYWRDGEAGMRSFKHAISDYGTPGSSPLSREISRITDHESADMLETASNIYFDNRMISGASPFFVHSGIIAFKDMVVMDFTQLASLRGKSAPVWDGEWEGFDMTHSLRFIHEGKERAIFISTDESGNNRLWEYIPRKRDDESIDLSGETVKTEIEQEAEFKKINFGNVTLKKRITRFDLWISEIERADISLYYRKDNNQQWIFWETKTICFELKNPEPGFKQLRTGHVAQLKTFTAPENATITGTEFQFKLRIKGHVKIDKIVAWAENLDILVYSEGNDSDCIENVIEPVELNYKIPVFNEPLGNYVDENGDQYVDENGDSYVG